MNKVILLVPVILVIAVAGIIFVSFRNRTQTNAPLSENTSSESGTPSNDSRVVTTLAVPLLSLNDSGQTGSVVFGDEGTSTKVVIDVTESALPSQTAVLRAGNCPTPGVVLFNVGVVANGKLSASIDTTINQLKPEMPLALVLAASPESTEYTSCAPVEIP